MEIAASKNDDMITPASTSVSIEVRPRIRQEPGRAARCRCRRRRRGQQQIAAADQEDRQRPAEAGARRHADDARIDQRIAKEALQRRARNRQTDTDQHRREDARQADLLDHGLPATGDQAGFLRGTMLSHRIAQTSSMADVVTAEWSPNR